MKACSYCAGAFAGEPLYEDADWTFRPMAGLPGSGVLWLRRHVESITELTEAELASLGPVAARISGAVEKATGAERVYLQVHSERVRHFHVSVLPREPSVPDEHRAGRLQDYALQVPETDRTREVASMIRRQLVREAA